MGIKENILTHKTVLMFINKGKKVYDGVLHVVKRLGIKKVISK